MSSTESTIVLESGASSNDDEYNNQVIQITNGLGANRAYSIIDYVGSSRTATVNEFIEIQPDTTSSFIIHIYSGICDTQNQDLQFKTIKLSSTASANDDFHNNCFITLFESNNLNLQTRRITDYNGTTKIVSIDTVLDYPITNNTLYIITGESGTAQTATSTTMTLKASQGHSTTDDYYNGLFIEIISGLGSGQTREITDYVGGTLVATVATWTTTPDSTSVYCIYSGWGATEFESSANYSQSTVALVSGAGQNVIIYQQLGLDNDNSANRGKYAINSSSTPSSVHTLVNVSNYFKIKLISIGTPLTGNFQTLFHTAKNKALTSFIEEPINKNNDCELTRSVISGKTNTGAYKNAVVSNEGHLKVDISRPTAAFGELQTTHLTPVSQINFPYYKNENIMKEFVDSGTIMSMNVEGGAGTQQSQSIYLPNGAQFTSSGAGDYFYVFDGGATQYYIWYDVDSGNTDPSATGTGVQVSITSSDSSSTVAGSTKTALDAIGGTPFSSTVFGNIVTITNSANGDVTSIQASNMPSTSGSAVTYNKSESSLELTNVAGIGSYSVVNSRRLHKYRPGQGGQGRFTVVFDTPVTGTQQIAGIGNQVSGFFFGYNSTSNPPEFGILHRKSGLASVQKLTITNGSGAADTLTITIDGVDFEMTLSGSISTTQVAQEIADNASLFLQGRWLVNAVASTVIFLSQTATGSRTTNTYGLNANGGTTAGTWSSITDGTAVVNEWTLQSNWNLKKLNGYESVGMHLNPQRGNVYQIQYQWLGYGSIVFSVEDDVSGQFVPIHQVEYTNKNTVPSVSQPAMKLLWGINTTISATSLTLKFTSGALFNEGAVIINDNIFSDTQSITTSNANEIHLVTYKNRLTFQGKGNNITISPSLFSFVNDATKSGTIRIYSDSTITSPQYNYVNENLSALVYDTSATVSNGILIFSFTLAGGVSENILKETLKEILLLPEQTLTITVQRSTTTNVEISSVVVWQEDQ